MKAKLLILLALFFCFNATMVFSQELIWSQEAENGILEGAADINDACANASGGEFVRLHAEEGNGLTFSNINIPEAGMYRLAIYYFYRGSQPLEVLVNGVSAGIHIFPTSIWCYEGAASLMEIGLEFQSGTNSLKFIPANGLNAPFLDKLEIYSIAPTQVNIAAFATRIEPGADVELTVSATDILTEDVEVELEVSGISPEKYTLNDPTLNISSGTSFTKTQITFVSEGISHGTDVLVSISAVGGDLVPGEQDVTAIRIVTQPETMYVSSSGGSDLNNGVDESSAWKTLQKVSSLLLLPGDSLLFKAGDVFNGQLRINGSGDENNRIYIGKYGEGELPEIDGAGAEGGAYSCAVLLENVDHITMQNLYITNDRKLSRKGEADGDAYGIQVLNSGDRVMKNFHFTDLTIGEIFPVTWEGVEFNKIQTAGIQFRTLQNTVPGKEKNISDVVVENCYIIHTTKAGIWSRHNNATAGLGNDSINRNMNLVFRNNHFYETGGSGIILSRSYNCLLENNIFEYTGSNVDPRMAARGSGAWFWNCRHVMAQFNKSMHVRGPGDSYGMHIDFANENVFLQYNYSEDSEGGFVEILGDNINSVYRFNVSVNDGFRDKKGNSIWVSDYAGSGTSGIKSDHNYIYNNTVYVDADITPDIVINGKNTFIYNNIFYATGDAEIGQTVELNTAPSGSLNVSHNLFFGSITNQFKILDNDALEGDPLLADPGALNSEGYKLLEGSIATSAGISFEEPIFPQAGKGIFKDIPLIPNEDHFGNPVSIATSPPNIGAYAGSPSALSKKLLPESALHAYVDHRGNRVRISWNATLSEKKDLAVLDLSGRILLREEVYSLTGMNSISLSMDSMENQGMLLVRLKGENSIDAIRVPVF